MLDDLTDKELINKAKFKLQQIKEASVYKIDLEACELIEELVKRLKKHNK
tara:strand:+ start:145 stop:294 length:150 start_codon:yes stop_codon:yes gene_type:complete